MNTIKHRKLASGAWQKFSLVEQLGNIGSEIGRMRKWQFKDKKLYKNAFQRTLELFDLTIEDRRWQKRLKEITRAREVFCDTVAGRKGYKTSLENLEHYFFQYALAARYHM